MGQAHPPVCVESAGIQVQQIAGFETLCKQFGEWSLHCITCSDDMDAEQTRHAVTSLLTHAGLQLSLAELDYERPAQSNT